MIGKREKRFLGCLRTNSRDSLTKISKYTKIPISTLFDRLKEGEREYIIKHTTLLDFSKLGFHCRACVFVKAKLEDREKLRAFLKEHESVNTVFKINNGYDFLADVVFPNVKDLEDFMELIQQNFPLQNYDVHYVIEDIVSEKFMETPENS